MKLKNKRVLITAGPTWVAVDNVRVISNIATGETGVLLANELIRLKADVTLVLGPVYGDRLDKNVKVIPFRFFDDLKNIITKEIKSKKYDILIHAAAVSDYKPKIKYNKKIKSGIGNLKLILKPTPKIIDCVKKLSPRLFLVGFKFEPGVTEKTLIERTKSFISRAKADLAVANSINSRQYKAYILAEDKITGPFLNKKILARNLVKEIGGRLCRRES